MRAEWGDTDRAGKRLGKVLGCSPSGASPPARRSVRPRRGAADDEITSLRNPERFAALYLRPRPGGMQSRSDSADDHFRHGARRLWCSRRHGYAIGAPDRDVGVARAAASLGVIHVATSASGVHVGVTKTAATHGLSPERPAYGVRWRAATPAGVRPVGQLARATSWLIDSADRQPGWWPPRAVSCARRCRVSLSGASRPFCRASSTISPLR